MQDKYEVFMNKFDEMDINDVLMFLFETKASPYGDAWMAAVDTFGESNVVDDVSEAYEY